MGVPLNFDEATVADYQAPNIEVAIFALPAAAAAGEVAGTTFLVSEHQLCTVYSASGQGSGKWEKKDTAKLAVEDAGDVRTKKEQSDCYHDSDYSN